MPARNPKNKSRELDMLILVTNKKTLERGPDGHARVVLEWRAGTRQWYIEGLVEPQSPLMDPKHNWQTYDTIPQGHGEAILKFLDWVHSLTTETPTPDTAPIPEEEGPPKTID